MYNCSGATLSTLPNRTEILNHTNWLDFSDNQINTLKDGNTYLKHISNLDLSKNGISYINDASMKNLVNLRLLDLSYNHLKILPKSIVKLTKLRKVWLSGNPFTCDCSTLWMRDWMANFTIGEDHIKIVKDYYYINCSNGIPVSNLNPVELGCFPKELTLLQEILIGLSVSFTVVFVIASIVINRRWNEVKWFVYLHFDILDKNDGNENLADKESDAFLSYR